MVSLDVVGEFALGESEPGAVLPDFVVVVLVVAVGTGAEVAGADDLAFLRGAERTSMRLMLVLWVHFGDSEVSFAGAMFSSRFFSMSTYGFTNEVGLIIEYWFWNVGGASRLTPNAISGRLRMVALNLASLSLPSKNFSMRYIY